jgi:hypothetical protein
MKDTLGELSPSMFVNGKATNAWPLALKTHGHKQTQPKMADDDAVVDFGEEEVEDMETEAPKETTKAAKAKGRGNRAGLSAEDRYAGRAGVFDSVTGAASGSAQKCMSSFSHLLF